jgi:hypothetical protein
MRTLLGLGLALGMIAAAAFGQATAAANSAPAAKKKTSTAKKAATVRRPSATAHASASGVRRPGAKAPVTRTVTWRNRQTAPSADRYKEIQQALAAKGYLQPGQATGVWDQNSVDALKRFQAQQNLDTTGKLNSLSLIALGLGPKHDATVPTQTAAPDESRR